MRWGVGGVVLVGMGVLGFEREDRNLENGVEKKN